MSKYLIADFVTEFSPKYDTLRSLAEPFRCDESLKSDIILKISDERLSAVKASMVEGTTLAECEVFALGGEFNRRIIAQGAIFLHASAIIYDGKAYLFSAPSGGGKSTHTRLWKQAFGDDVSYINDDKPVIRRKNGIYTVFGTPFDGGSGIANNVSAPLGGIVFVEKAQDNSIVRLNSSAEILNRLYFGSLRILGVKSADAMLNFFEQLILNADFYLLKCNSDISAAYTAHDLIINN